MGKNHWEQEYLRPLSEIPWEIDSPPRELLFVLSNGMVKPCKMLDISCGTGNYARFLAQKGFEVTAIDISRTALKIAKEKAKGTSASFLEMDSISPSFEKSARFEFILDYSFLHHVPLERTKTYARNYVDLLGQGGILLLVCYSLEDSNSAPVKTGTHGNTMYYRSKEEIESAYAPLKMIHYEKTTLGKHNHHKGHFFVFKKE